MLIVFQCKVHNTINPVLQLLQKDDQDISNSSVMLQRAVKMMKTLHRLFEEVHEEAVNLAGIWSVTVRFLRNDSLVFYEWLMRNLLIRDCKIRWNVFKLMSSMQALTLW